MSGAGGRTVSVRRHAVINRPAAEVWARAGDPARLHEWFPGMTSCSVDGDTRVVTLGSGMSMPEQLVEVDPIQRRIRYRITAPPFREHEGTFDVIPIDDGSCLAVYSTVADPPTMALVIGGATGGALAELKRQVEAGRQPAASGEEQR